MVSYPETGSDFPIGSDRYRGCDTPESGNAESIIKELDMSDEQWEAAAIHITSYQRRLANSYNKRVKPRVFQPGDLVLRKVFENTTCHAPIPCPTRLADPNRVRVARPYTGTLDLIFFSTPNWYLWV